MNPTRKSRTLAATVGIKVAHNVIVFALLLGTLMVAMIETPKESIQRPGLDRDALIEACAEAVRADCIDLR